MKSIGLCTDQKIALLCDDFLYLNNYKTAEEIKNIDSKVEFLFTSVMSLEVIHRQDEKDTLLDDYINRALLLIKIKEQSTVSLALDYDIEYLISQYSRKLCKNKLGRGKININVDAIKRIAKNMLMDDFVALLDESNNSGETSNVEFSGAFVKMQEFALVIRDLYATDDVYGLENTLNTDIRHNGVVPTLRAVFEANEVICQKKNDKYIENVYYENHSKNSLKSNAYLFFQERIKEFSETVDSLINNLKNKYLHVFTNDLDDKYKLFKLTISDDEVLELLTCLEKNQDFDEIINAVVALLNDKTRQAMKEGSTTLKLGFKNEIDKEIRNLIQSMEKQEKINSGFINCLKHTKNQFEHVIDEVSQWLNFINKSADDFALMVPITEAYEFVEKTHPTIKTSIKYQNIDYLCDINCDGEHLATFIRMFLILFQNAAKSIKQNGECHIQVNCEFQNNIVRVTIENNYDHLDKELILKIINSLNGNEILKGASKGSGSGIFKVKKMLSHELKVTHDLDISFNEAKNIFKVVIDYDLNTIQTEIKNEVSDN